MTATPVQLLVDSLDSSRQIVAQRVEWLGGIVRWASIECATEGLAGIGEFPPEEEILPAGQAMPCR